MAWDTNVLSLYEQYGSAMWSGDAIEIRRADPADVQALGDLVSIWMWWDLRFVVLDDTATDYKKPRPPADLSRRELAMDGLREALSLGLDGEEEEPPGRADELPQEIVDTLPDGHDQLLVADAYRLGMDVFLTSDKGILAHDEELRQFGLRCMRPASLLGALANAGVEPGWSPERLAGLAPDLGRMSALISALGDD